ncbi:L-type lectin-domain containing receptor kinase IV.1 [Ancistrocladus abbreviatus]
MISTLPTLVFLALAAGLASAVTNLNITFNGFQSANLSLDGIAEFTSNGLLKLTNATVQEKGHAFYPYPVTFRKDSSASSFSTTFVFAIISQYSTLSGHGIVFVLAPTRGLPGALASQYLGLFNSTDNGNITNHVVGVELDTILSSEFADINDNHVGIDVNSLHSVASAPASYFVDNSTDYRNLTLISGKPMQVWIEYDGSKKEMNVTLAPINIGKPKFPLLSLPIDLSPIVKDTMYVGFSSSTGSVLTSHYVLGWSFAMNGPAQDLDLSRLPKLPRIGPKQVSKVLTIGLPVILVTAASVVITSLFYVVRRKRKFAEEMEDWESDYGPHRFRYKDLYVATKGFKDKELLGTGGFGRVYRGILPVSKIEIAVKRVSHESRQGMKEFVAEIVSIGRLRHRNLVPLLGYCRRKGELLLVYDYMPNGSLDKYIYDQPKCTLSWSQRFGVIKGVASGLFYLHEGWEQVVVHRDIKASNVLLDAALNGRLGDFGLARLYDHGTDPQTTHVVGTLGYLAPEHTRNGKATRSTDVFAFGAFLLEVVCGRRPIDLKAPTEDMILVDMVFGHWSKGQHLQMVDPKLGGDYDAEQVELVLKMGLICSNTEPEDRPTMGLVVQYLEGVLPLPDLSALSLHSGGVAFANREKYVSREGFSDLAMLYPSSGERVFSHSSSVAESNISEGRYSIKFIALRVTHIPIAEVFIDPKCCSRI